MLPEFRRLNQLRLDRDWTWGELATRIARVVGPISPRTLHHLLTQEVANPRDRTLHKLRKFLDHERAATRRRRRRSGKTPSGVHVGAAL